MTARPLFLLAALPLLAACGPDRPNTVFESARNPAAAFCESEGGFFNANDGSCLLPSGDRVNAEGYYLTRFNP